MSWLAHLMVRMQEEGALISPWSLMASLLLQAPAAALTEHGLPWHQLAERTLRLRKLALDFGAHLNWPGGRRGQILFLSGPFSLLFSRPLTGR